MWHSFQLPQSSIGPALCILLILIRIRRRHPKMLYCLTLRQRRCRRILSLYLYLYLSVLSLVCSIVGQFEEPYTFLFILTFLNFLYFFNGRSQLCLAILKPRLTPATAWFFIVISAAGFSAVLTWGYSTSGQFLWAEDGVDGSVRRDVFLCDEVALLRVEADVLEALVPGLGSLHELRIQLLPAIKYTKIIISAQKSPFSYQIPIPSLNQLSRCFSDIHSLYSISFLFANFNNLGSLISFNILPWFVCNK